MYVVGNPAMFYPLRRSEALESALQVAGNRWRVWIEHKDTGARIFESEAETKYLAERQLNR